MIDFEVIEGGPNNHQVVKGFLKIYVEEIGETIMFDVEEYIRPIGNRFFIYWKQGEHSNKEREKVVKYFKDNNIKYTPLGPLMLSGEFLTQLERAYEIINR